jgi:nitroreductase
MDSSHYDAIVGLRAIRDYDERQLSEEDLSRILRAAQWTGSSKNLQNWSWVVVQDPEQQARIAECGDFTVPVRNAPTTLCLVQEPDGYEFDTGRLAQNVMLAAAALGVGSCPITLHREEMAHAALGLPEGARCRYAVTLGYPAPGAGPRRFGGRKPLEEMTHRDRYGS